MNKIIQDTVKLYYYVRRNGIINLAGRIKNIIYPQKMTYEAWKIKRYRKYKKNLLPEQEDRLFDTICLYKCALSNTNEKVINNSKIRLRLCDKVSECKTEFVLLCATDFSFYPYASNQIEKMLRTHSEADIYYFDHDVDGIEPYFKPDFNKELMFSSGYIGPVVLVRRRILEDMENVDQLIGKNRFYNILFSCIEKTERMYHLSDILYSVRKKSEEIYEDLLNDAVSIYLKERDIPAELDKNILVKKTCHIKYKIQNSPVVSIIIPNKDHVEDLNKCIDSIMRQSYKNIEIIIIENNSTQKEVFRYYRQLEQEDIRVLQWEKCFNYSAINNYGVKYAKGTYYLFLNNDIEFQNKNDIEEMLGLCQQKENGAVGIKLLYADGRIQHAGVVIGYGGIAGHAFLGCDATTHGYMNRVDCVQNYSAVTAACMMVKKNAFDVVCGFDEQFEVAFNDIDFCLRLGEKGYKIVYTPYASAWHYESKTRGTEDTLQKMHRFNTEVDRFCHRWKKIIHKGDPAYNANLSLERWDFEIKSRKG